MAKVPMAVTVDDIRDLCETAVSADDILHVEERKVGHSLKMMVCYALDGLDALPCVDLIDPWSFLCTSNDALAGRVLVRSGGKHLLPQVPGYCFGWGGS